MSEGAAARSAGPLAPHGAWLALAGAAMGWHTAAGPHPFDAGELVAAGALLGGSHPPGQPLHALLAQAASLLPLGPIPWRVALLTTATAVAAAWLVGRWTGWLLESLGARHGRLARLAPDAAALAVLLSPPVARQATRVEVYGLALGLALIATLALLRWGTARSGAGGALRVAALSAGLAVAVHPPHALAPLVAGLVLLLALRRDVLRARSLAWAGAACLAGLCVIAYLPARGAAGAPMWGDPTTAAGLWDYVSGRAYRQNLGAAGGPLGAQLGGGLLEVALGTGLVALIGVGRLASLARTSRAARAALLGTAASLVTVPVVAIDAQIPDTVAYLGPPVAALVATGMAGLAWPAARPSHGHALAALLLVAAANPASLPRFPEAVDQDAPVLETLAGALTDSAPPRSLAMVETDFEGASWMMAQAVDGARPDVAFFAPGLATSSWHWASLAHHPLFDGSPIRGRGASARAAYVDGAFRHAAGRVPIAVGPTPVAGPGTLAGPYRLLWPTERGRGDPIAAGSMGERLAPAITRALRRGPGGDRDVVDAIVRHHQVARAQRLAERRAAATALVELGHAMEPLAEAERALLADPLPSAPSPFAVPVVQTPGAFLTTRGEVLRAAAVILWTGGAIERAEGLLGLQLDAGDAAAALQLGWLHALAGDGDTARRLLEGVRAEAPELEAEVRLLEDGLGGGAR